MCPTLTCLKLLVNCECSRRGDGGLSAKGYCEPIQQICALPHEPSMQGWDVSDSEYLQLSMNTVQSWKSRAWFSVSRVSRCYWHPGKTKARLSRWTDVLGKVETGTNCGSGWSSFYRRASLIIPTLYAWIAPPKCNYSSWSSYCPYRVLD